MSLTLLNDDNIRDRIVDFCRVRTNHNAILEAVPHPAPLPSHCLFKARRWNLVKKHEGDFYITRVYECWATPTADPFPFIKMFVYTDVTDTIVIKMVPDKPCEGQDNDSDTNAPQ